MRLLPVLALLLASPVAVAEAPATHGAPATVVLDRLEVVLEGQARARERRVLHLRVHDPDTCTAGILVPPALDGASHRGAQVHDQLLVCPPGLEADTVIELQSSTVHTRGPFSGVWLPPPDLPVLEAEVVLRAPTWVPLAVWTDEGARTVHGRHGGRSVQISWSSPEARGQGQVVWTSWPDWDEAGERLEATIRPLLAPSREAMGRHMAANIAGASIPLLAERVYQAIELTPGESTWEGASSTRQVLSAGAGTAADRGVVLISLLRLAGHDARPALYRPASAPGAAPVSLAAPALLDRPAVAVVQEHRVVWIDPGSNRVAIPELPSAMVGGLAWMPGELPVPVARRRAVDGQVSVLGRVAIDREGAATWSATLHATGVAQEWLRERLGPLDEQGRRAALRRLVEAGHPEMERFTVQASGVDDPHRPMRIQINGYQPGRFTLAGAALDGTLPPFIAPALGGWLPPHLLVREEIVISPPSGLQPFSAVHPTPVFHPDATLARTIRREGAQLTLWTEVERPYRTTSPGRDAAADGFLREQADQGPRLLLLPPPSTATLRSLRESTADRPTAEAGVLEALMWWEVELPRRAFRTLRRAVAAAGADAVAEQLDRHARPGDPRPWMGLFEGAATDTERLRAVMGIEQAGAHREAWLRTARLQDSHIPEVKLAALLLADRLQGDPPDAERDPEGAALWRPHEALLAAADEASALLADTPEDGHPLVLRRRAERALAEGRHADAEGLLTRALRPGPDPLAMILQAHASAEGGVPVDQVVRQIERAVELAPFDAEVVGGAGRAMAQVGQRERALYYAMASARLSFRDSARWLEASQAAVAFGDLHTGLFAARRASDLAPGDPEAGDALARLALWALDRDAWQHAQGRASGAERIAEWPGGVSDVLARVPDHALLAVLQFHEDAVLGDANLLRLRAQLRLDAGLLDSAARDGAVLVSRHRSQRGEAILFAATAGRQWSPASMQRLDAIVAQDPVARAIRMEYRLVAGTGDPLVDARGLPADLRAELLLRASSDMAGLVAETPGWPADASQPPGRAPRGFRVNRPLGAAPGVAAFSDAERGLGALRVSEPTGLLPPPLAQLYTPANPPLASLPGGGQLLRLRGGPLPLYAAIRLHGEGEAIGLGFTAEAARVALEAAME